MKTTHYCIIFFFCIFFSSYAQSGIKIGGGNPYYLNGSAVLQVDSSTKGVLIPRLSSSERDLISSPETGLMIYNTTTMQIETNSGTTVAPLWVGTITPDADALTRGKLQLTNELGGTAVSPTISNAAVISKVLTGFVTGTVSQTVSPSDNILQAFQKIDGNVALKAPLASPAFTGTPTAPTATVGNSTTQIATTEFVIKSHNRYIPTTQYPTYDATGNKILSGALWIGYDTVLQVWKYNKQASGRGLVDPGNPSAWTENGLTIGVFNGDFTGLPNGTHINLKYDPRTKAAIYNQDDIVVRIGTLWVDKYEARVVDVATGTFIDNDNFLPESPANTAINGSGQALPTTYLSFSQKNNGTSGASWNAAQVALANNEKRFLNNAEWQIAAAGTARTTNTGMTNYGENWFSAGDQDVSRFGIVGCVGSLWEWVADQGQYGPIGGTSNQATTTQASGTADYQYHINGFAYTGNTLETGANYATTYTRSALLRGGSFVTSGIYTSDSPGVFTVSAYFAPTYWFYDVGFRGVRN